MTAFDSLYCSNAFSRTASILSTPWTCAEYRGLETRSNSKKKPPTSITPGDDSYQGSEGAATPQNAEIKPSGSAFFRLETFLGLIIGIRRSIDVNNSILRRSWTLA